MDPAALLGPFDQLLAFGGIIMPLATAAPPLLVHFRKEDNSRTTAVLFIAPAPALLAAIAVETLWLCTKSALPEPFAIFLLVTTTMLIPAYVLLARNLPRILDREIAAANRRRLEELTTTRAIGAPRLAELEDMEGEAPEGPPHGQ